MNVIFLLSVTFAAAFVITLTLYGAIMNERARIYHRLKAIANAALTPEMLETAATKEPVEGEIVKLRTKEHIPEGPFLLLNRYYKWLAKRLEKAHLFYRPQEYFLLSLAIAVFFMVIAFFSMGIKNYLSFFLAVVLGAVGFWLPCLYLSLKETILRGLLSSQVGDMLMLLSNYLRAGHSFTRAVEFVSRELPSPLSDELKKFIKDVSLGAGMLEALTDLEERTGDEDLGLVITAIKIQHQVGGNLAEVLDNIHHTIRERIRIKGEVKTLTAEGRLSAIILGILPVAMAFIILVINPGYLNVLFTEPSGQLLLVLAALGEIVGVIVIRRMVQIEV